MIQVTGRHQSEENLGISLSTIHLSVAFCKVTQLPLISKPQRNMRESLPASDIVK